MPHKHPKGDDGKRRCNRLSAHKKKGTGKKENYFKRVKKAKRGKRQMSDLKKWDREAIRQNKIDSMDATQKLLRRSGKMK